MKIEKAYQHCQHIAATHYENFPVASWFMPKKIRAQVAAIYAFARKADDIADEGDDSCEQRLAKLVQLSDKLEKLSIHDADPVIAALADTANRFKLPLNLLHDLLSAFAQDVTVNRYSTFEEITDYASRSANPVGRMLLHLIGKDCAEYLELSDKICTALQLINFYQDITQDIEENNRVYIPLQELEAYELGVEDIRMQNQSAAMQNLMQFQYHRAHSMLKDGRFLGKKIRGKFGFELRLIIAGGLAICHKLKKQEDLYARPRLNLKDKITMFLYALFN